MKYKNIELLEGKSELFCYVIFDNNNNNIKISIKDIRAVCMALKGSLTKMLYIEPVLNDVILVRSTAISLDNSGVELLKVVYDKLVAANFKAKIKVGISVDHEYFKKEDGSEYNVDEVTYDEFLSHLEY